MFIMCKCLGFLDKLLFRGCGDLGWGLVIRLGDNWFWEWLCVLSIVCIVCIGVVIGGGEGCLINVIGGVIFIVMDDWELD